MVFLIGNGGYSLAFIPPLLLCTQLRFKCQPKNLSAADADTYLVHFLEKQLYLGSVKK